MQQHQVPPAFTRNFRSLNLWQSPNGVGTQATHSGWLSTYMWQASGKRRSSGSEAFVMLVDSLPAPDRARSSAVVGKANKSTSNNTGRTIGKGQLFVKLLDLHRLMLEPKMTAHIPLNHKNCCNLQFSMPTGHECYALKELKNHATESERISYQHMEKQRNTVLMMTSEAPGIKA